MRAPVRLAPVSLEEQQLTTFNSSWKALLLDHLTGTAVTSCA